MFKGQILTVLLISLSIIFAISRNWIGLAIMKSKFVVLFGLLWGAVLASVLTDGYVKNAKAETTEYVVLDPVTGIAIFGYDPVSYFIEQQAVIGQLNHEVSWKGAQWNFCQRCQC